MFNIEKFKLKIMFDKNKHVHKKDLKKFFDLFFYFIIDTHKAYKKEKLIELYNQYGKIMNKILALDEEPNPEKYLFYYFLISEEILDKKYYFFKNDENFKKIYQEFINLILLSYEKDGYLTLDEFTKEIEKLKKRFKKELKEINKEIEKFSYATRKNNYEKIKQFFIKKLKETK